MGIDITNFFGLDLTKEPNERWMNEKSGLVSRRRRKNSPFLCCSYSKNSRTFAIVLSESVRDELNLLFQNSIYEEINNQEFKVIESSGYKFMTNEVLLEYLILLITKL